MAISSARQYMRKAGIRYIENPAVFKRINVQDNLVNTVKAKLPTNVSTFIDRYDSPDKVRPPAGGS